MKQTAVDWLFQELWDRPKDKMVWYYILEKAKQMEKEQIMKTARQCHFEGVRQSAKTSEDYINYGEEYYKETYEK